MNLSQISEFIQPLNSSDGWLNSTVLPDNYSTTMNESSFPFGRINTTRENEQIQASDCTVYNFIVSGILLGIVCLNGYIGNILTIITLSQQRKSGTRVLLQALAVVDICLLIPALFVKCVPHICLYIAEYGEACFSFWFSMYPFLVQYLWPIGTMAHCSTVWITVLVALTRYIAVCRPLHAKTLTRISYVYIQLAIVITFSVLYCVPRFFEYKITEMIHPEKQVPIYLAALSDFFKNKTYQIIYRNISFFLLMSIIPLIVLTVFTTFLVRAVWKARKSRLRMVQMTSSQRPASHKRENNSKEDSSLTFTLIIVVVVFFFCQLPAAINRILFMMDNGNDCGHFQGYFNQVSDFLVFLNSSVNFIIYCVCSSRFRKDLRRIGSIIATCCVGGSSSSSTASNGRRYSTNTTSLGKSMATSDISNGSTAWGDSGKGSSLQLAPGTLSSVTSLPSMLSLAEAGTQGEPDGLRYVSQETIITHL